MYRMRDRLKFPLIAVAFAAMAAYCFSFVDKVQSQQTQTSEPLAYAIGPGQSAAVQTTSAVQIIGTNPTRRFIEICNPTTSTTIWIAPLPMVATTPTNTNGTPGSGGSIPLFPVTQQPAATVSATLSCYRTPFPPGTQSGGFVGAAWNAVAQGSVLGSLTIFEY